MVHRPRPGGTNGIGTLWTVTSTGRSRYYGYTVGLNKSLSDRYAFQATYTYSKDRSDDDNERDPFTLRYARITDLDAEYGFPTATSGIGSTPGSFGRRRGTST